MLVIQTRFGRWKVQSETHPEDDPYDVKMIDGEPWTCTCKDSINRYPKECKHIKEARLFNESKGIIVSQKIPTPE